MSMLRWMCGVTRKDKIRNEHIRGTTRVAQASKKITEGRLNWYGHVMRDLKSRPTGLRAGEETDRAMWRRKITSHTGDPT